MSEIAKKKVLLVITKSNWGGAQKYVFDLATALPRESFDVAVVFGEGGELEDRLRVAGVRTIRIEALKRDVNVFKDVAVFFELIRIFKNERPDVVHLNSSKIGGVGALAGRICSILGSASNNGSNGPNGPNWPKIIFTAHGWAFNEENRSNFSRKVIAFLQWVTVILSHKVIAVSQKTADQILAFPLVKREKVAVIYNGVAEVDLLGREEARRALAGGTVARQTAGAPTQTAKKLNRTTWIGTISELHPNKGLDVTLSAFAKIAQKYPQSFFIVIGDGQEKVNLQKQIADLGLTDRAFLVGFIADARKYLRAFNIFTLTSRTEALSYAILEAGLAELPIIATSVGGNPEIINSPDVGLLVPTGKKSPQAIADALEKLINQPAYAEIIGKNLKQRITSEFSYAKMHSETFALYQ